MSSIRRVIGLVFLVAAVWVGARLLGLAEKRPVAIEIHYRLGDPSAVRRLEAELRRVGDPETVARFETELVSGDVVQRPRLLPGAYEAHIRLYLTDRRTVATRRRFEVDRGATITIDLSRELS